MRKLTLGFILFFAFTQSLTAQVKIGNNPNTLNTNSILELESTNQGLLVPRIALVALNSASPMTDHVEGMVLYNTASSGTYPNQVVPGYYINDGSQWLRLESTSSVSNNYGDVKQGFQSTDHAGWYLLDGRDITGLPSNAQLAAATLGFTGNIPDSRNKFLQHGTTLGVTGGASDNLIKIFQSNLPEVDFLGTAESAGSHVHSIDPPNVATSSNGNHSHSIDPPSTNTSQGGSHRHNGLASNNDVNNSTSQGYPQGNNHQSFRSSDRPRQQNINEFAISSAGSHSHTLNIGAFNSSTSGLHTHTLNIGSFNSSNTGNHTHPVEVSSGGSGSELNITPEYLSINNFIFLGQ